MTDSTQKYYCDTGYADCMTVYPSVHEGERAQIVSFVIESKHCRDVKTSIMATMDDVRRLRDQLNQLLGE